ncbi:metal-dependent hydrolase [Clostridium sp. SHJSY1]|uniref:metal-dependent hydrolase n=1 Tax=Clostridium sp. SHJSY1 TaxID=2942483 RepID=UPI0028744E50|nr:metal-dependent hydrolase [Clostridium sp. SHJSY1]MDS0527891.1 metal-dependent hydrolase [Clostridium sp. SHJSY1]
MTGKTHMSVGVGAATVLLPTNDMKTIFGGTALALIGSLIVDIDTEKSGGSVMLKEAAAGAVILVALGIILNDRYKINILKYIIGNKNLNDMLPALGILTLALIIGKFSSHRSFMHSIVGVIAFTVPAYMLFGEVFCKWFFVGYVSHIAIDMFNKKGVRLFYPLKSGVCLDMCKADGMADKALFFMFIGVTISKYITVITQ